HNGQAGEHAPERPLAVRQLEDGPVDVVGGLREQPRAGAARCEAPHKALEEVGVGVDHRSRSLIESDWIASSTRRARCWFFGNSATPNSPASRRRCVFTVFTLRNSSSAIF